MNPPDNQPRVKWTDDLLDLRFAGIDRVLNSRIDHMAEDVTEVRDTVRGLSDELRRTADALRSQELKIVEAKMLEREELRKERVSDRRWLIGTIVAVFSLVVATMSVLMATGAFA